MKLLPSILCFSGLALARVCAAEVAVNTVSSVAPSTETPRSATIAPTSNLPPGFAHYVATQLLPVIPGSEVFTVLPTGSMRPAFDDNTILITEPAPFGELQVGDIVVFRHTRTGERIVHRIIERRKGGYWTKGDRNTHMDDDLVTEANYLGRVYGIFYTSRGGGRPLPDALRQGRELIARAR